MADRPGEFELIARFFAPLAEGSPGALGLTDDAALIDLPSGHQVVATADMLVAGVHFFAGEPPADIASKSLRVNLSDLAAMGATPLGYLLSLALDETVDSDWLAAFADGLAADQAEFGIGLLGGDTVSTPGPLTVSVTALGAVATGRALRRGGAAAGDRIFVSGTIGDGALGVMLERGDIADVDDDDGAWFRDRLRRPTPRLDLGPRLIGVASAAVDISDGLVADLGHVCEASGLAATIEAGAVPLSPAARRQVDNRPDLLKSLISGGDDFELLFAVPDGRKAAVEALSAELDLPLTAIGAMTAASSSESAGPAVVHGPGGAIWTLESGGYRHF
jgi:thiamine-monophosphate kinase